ncbi:MAG: hypothetical protein LBU34_06630 [Planctomycetaceae bacterium]|nr:hypothetical protein [Planctomycetaceae bacterium]
MHISSLAGLWFGGGGIRRLRCAPPPVMHNTPLAGLRFRLPCEDRN